MSTIAFTVTYKLSFTESHSNKLLKPKLQILSLKPGLFDGFVSNYKKAVSRTMPALELGKTSAFKSTMSSISSSSDVDEGVNLIQQEAFVSGPTGIVVDGLESALNRLSKWIVAASFVAVILWRHDAAAMWAVMGSVLNSLLSITLKQILKHERPDSTRRSDPGMPSSHAQSIFFIVMFVILSIMELLGINGFTLALSGIALAFSSYLTWLRVSQHLHTMNQVFVGAALGSIFSILCTVLSWKPAKVSVIFCADNNGLTKNCTPFAKIYYDDMMHAVLPSNRFYRIH
ncbi:PAP2 domain-containing protein [Cephalotus follicularis]|uniref:PAP2 domain-containing protein n=1 Tax=Cephalotus follicularis TaxID=3775 RepID=A0A1Q3D5H4_CEPFO|nr:PAP2 domain-containing protein [Cephalotus follicularis]